MLRRLAGLCATLGLALLLLPVVVLPARAGSIGGSLGFCEEPAVLSAVQRDRLLRFTALLKDALEGSGRRVALISRSGTDLRFFDQQYSHAGIALRASRNGPWSVRQLYFACAEQRPRLFDQGMAGFVFGSDSPRSGFVSIVLLPDAAADRLEQAALDNRRALELLGATYSANAYAYALAYQNCNQWVAELFAEAWADGADKAEASAEASTEAVQTQRRANAQTWLRQRAYQPHRFEMPWAPLAYVAGWMPWLHNDDHPADALRAGYFDVSMPPSLEAFVQQQVAGAERIEFCHQGEQAVVHRGWRPIGSDCVAAEGDEVVRLD